MRKILALCVGLLLAGCVTKIEKPVPAPAGADPYTALMLEFMKGAPLPEPAFRLADPGSPDPVDYTKYGTFKNLGTDQYQYELTDPEGLKKAVGEGIFPNEDGVLSDPAYGALAKTDILETRHWDALQLPDLQAAFFIWAQAPEEPGVKAYFTAAVLENAEPDPAGDQGLLRRAGQLPPLRVLERRQQLRLVRRARGAVEHQAAVQRVSEPRALARGRRVEHPERAGHGPRQRHRRGQSRPFREEGFAERLKTLPDLRTTPVVERRGKGKVQAVKYANGHWQLRVDGKPFVVRGVTYGPTEIGLGPNNASELRKHRWQFTDKNNNGKIDAAYDAWVDKNGTVSRTRTSRRSAISSS